MACGRRFGGQSVAVGQELVVPGKEISPVAAGEELEMGRRI